MNLGLNFLRSLLLTSFMSFAAPTLLLGGVVGSLLLLCYVPQLDRFCETGVTCISTFLATFGSGQPLEGVIVIGLTCSLVGALFAIYVLYQHHTLGGN